MLADRSHRRSARVPRPTKQAEQLLPHIHNQPNYLQTSQFQLKDKEKAVAQSRPTTASNTKNGSRFEVHRDMDTGRADDMDQVQDTTVPRDKGGHEVEESSAHIAGKVGKLNSMYLK